MHFMFLFGPPAVGKMAVGRELADRTGFKLLHNHMTVEPVSYVDLVDAAGGTVSF